MNTVGTPLLWGGFAVVVVIMLGAVGGRAILGPSPTLAYGIIALLTLITMEPLFRGGSARWKLGPSAWDQTRPRLR